LDEEKTRLSVQALVPAIDEDGIDQTRWPKDDQVSEWVGKPVKLFDAGDANDFPEAIYDAR